MNISYPKEFGKKAILYFHLLNGFTSQPAIIMFKVHNRNTRCEICSKSTIKTPKRRQWRRSGVFIVTFRNISHLVLVFLLLTLNK